jgi:transcription initiation factor TFIIIB Brf1 subunit/transcription initiation factor TFIIB
MIRDVKDVKACPECGSANIVCNEDKQQVICKDCGAIYEPLTSKDEKNLEDASDVI